MALVPYTNNSDTIVHIDGKTIMPGESRPVDETHVPGYGVGAESEEKEPESNPLAELLLGNVQAVLSVLADLTADQLAELAILEADSANPRKGVLDGIEKRRLELAQEGIK